MKMELNFRNRFGLHAVLPTKAHVLALKLTKALREELLPDADEQKASGMMVNPQGQPRWEANDEPAPRTFEISKPVFDLVRTELKAREAKGEIDLGLLELYEMFVDNDYVEE